MRTQVTWLETKSIVALSTRVTTTTKTAPNQPAQQPTEGGGRHARPPRARILAMRFLSWRHPHCCTRQVNTTSNDGVWGVTLQTGGSHPGSARLHTRFASAYFRSWRKS